MGDTRVFGVSKASALLFIAVDLADETVDVDHEAIITGAGAGPPRARESLRQQPVELTDMPKGERPQERPQCRRGRQPPAQQPARAARTQHIAIIDRIGAEQHRVDQRHHLPARVRRPRTITTKRHQATHERLNPEPPRKHRDERYPSVRNDPLIIEDDLNTIQSDRRAIMHHLSDLLIPGRDSRNLSLPSPIQEVTQHPNPDNTGGSRLKMRL